MLFLPQLATPPAFPMTIDSIMRGRALVGRAPSQLRWAADGSYVSFTWAQADNTQNPKPLRFRVKKDGTGLIQKEDEPRPANPIPDGDREGDLVVYTKDDDLFTYNVASKETKQLTKTDEKERNPSFAGSADAILFVQDSNLYRYTISTSTRKQLTDLKTDQKPESFGNQPAGAPIVINVLQGFRAGNFTVSPSGDTAVLDVAEVLPPGKQAPVPRYITDSGFSEIVGTYERAGAKEASTKLIVVNLKTGGISEIAPARPARLFRILWSPKGGYGIVRAFSNDNKDSWILGYDESTGKSSTLWDEHCDAWIGGPAAFTQGWLPDGSRFYFGAESSGFANLYTMAPTGGKADVLVGGNFEVSDIRLDSARNRFTFVSSEGSPFIRHLDTVPVTGGKPRKLADLSADEDMEYAIGPDGEQVAVVRSKPNRPGELYVNNLQVTTTPTAEWLSYAWVTPDVVWVPSPDGVKVPSRLYKPRDWKAGGPAVVFVHGAGYLQNVYDGWSHYYREYMFHHFLMEQGYAVLDMDYRASAGYGRDWRTAIYRHMGGKDLDDNVAGAEYLVRELGVDKDRIGIYGGSYGGFITYMAMFTKPGVFAAGAALRPVGDWASYHHGYTSPILNNPQDDPEAYKQSSPINFVAGLKGSLLICHGMVDMNVQFQDSVRIVDKLIQLRKKNWWVAPYPTDDHDFSHEASWADEYGRIFELFETTIGSRRPKQ